MLISLLVILVLAILIFISLFQSAKTWGWTNIIFVFLIFVTGIFGAYSGSQALKARHAWMDRAKQNQSILEANEKKYRETLNGPDDALMFTPNSFRGANLELNVAMIGKGRVWEDASVQIQGENAVATISSESGDGAAQLAQDTILYAFREEFIESTPPQKFASTFIGTFQVSGTSGNQATLKPLFVSADGQSDMQGPQTAWSFYEKMPIDDRGIFKRHAGIDADSDEFDIDNYRNLLISRYLTPEKMGLDTDSVEYEQLIDDFAFDGLQMGIIQNWIAGQTDRKSDIFDPGIENLYVRLRFTAPSRPFQVDGTGSASENAFDLNGRAVDRSLHYGSDISFNTGDTIVVPKLTGVLGYDITDADGSTIRIPPLVETMDVERVGGNDADIYRRMLKNYPHLLTQTTQQIRVFEESLAEVQRVKAITDKGIDEAMAQQSVRADKLNDLEADLDGYQRDLAAVSQSSAEISQELNRQRGLIETYYKQLIQMYAEIAEASN